MVTNMDDYGIPDGTVAVGVDGSTGSGAALSEAVHTAVAERRSLTILHAVEGGSPAQAVLSEAREAVRRQAADLEVHLVLRVVDPRDLLVAASERAAVLVVGSRGRGPVRSVLLGSVSLAATRRALCPVVVVRPHHPGLVRHGVLVGADGSEGSAPVLDYAFRHASSRGLPLTVLHVVEVPEEATEEHRLLVSESMSGLRENYPDVPVHVDVVHGGAGEVLLEAAERMNCVVLGAHRGGLARHSVTAGIIERAHCPVVVVPIESDSVFSHV